MDKDIVLAYQEENMYYKDKDRLHSNTLNILDYISKAGYDNYDDYYSDLQEYLLKIQDYKIVEEPYIDPSLHNPYILNKVPAFLYQIHCDTNYAFVTNNFDKEEILKNYNYQICKLGYDFSSGPIISESGDLRLDLIYPIQIELKADYFLSKLANYFKKYYDDVKVDNNDILIDGKKVCGSVMFCYNEMKVLLLQINFVDKKDVIQDICGITDKVPGHIDSSIVSAEDVKNEFLSWLRL